ncbi:hypothetical protein N9W89_00375 [Hellea sp.]|nr:hypothetical protein [Hellea sp.]
MLDSLQREIIQFITSDEGKTLVFIMAMLPTIAWLVSFFKKVSTKEALKASRVDNIHLVEENDALSHEIRCLNEYILKIDPNEWITEFQKNNMDETFDEAESRLLSRYEINAKDLAKVTFQISKNYTGKIFEDNLAIDKALSFCKLSLKLNPNSSLTRSLLRELENFKADHSELAILEPNDFIELKSDVTKSYWLVCRLLERIDSFIMQRAYHLGYLLSERVEIVFTRAGFLNLKEQLDPELLDATNIDLLYLEILVKKMGLAVNSGRNEVAVLVANKLIQLHEDNDGLPLNYYARALNALAEIKAIEEDYQQACYFLMAAIKDRLDAEDVSRTLLKSCYFVLMLRNKIPEDEKYQNVLDLAFSLIPMIKESCDNEDLMIFELDFLAAEIMAEMGEVKDCIHLRQKTTDEMKKHIDENDPLILQHQITTLAYKSTIEEISEAKIKVAQSWLKIILDKCGENSPAFGIAKRAYADILNSKSDSIIDESVIFTAPNDDDDLGNFETAFNYKITTACNYKID